MKRHWSTRLFGASLALWFALAMLGPEVHQCPLHDVHPPIAPAAAAHASGHASHGAPPSHQHCSCPQACCSAGIGVPLVVAPVRWTAAGTRIADVTPAPDGVVLPGAPPHLFPFALAPPHTLA